MLETVQDRFFLLKLKKWEIENKLKAKQWTTEYERSAVLSGRQALKNGIILDRTGLHSLENMMFSVKLMC